MPALFVGTALALAAGLMTVPAQGASALPVAQQDNAAASGAVSALADRAKDKKVDLSKIARLRTIDLKAGARSIQLSAKTIFAQSTTEGTLNVTLSGPLPYARINPTSGKSYFASAGELEQYFTALLGPNPTIAISYGNGTGARSFDLNKTLSAPVYDMQSQTITFQAVGAGQPISGSNARVRFIATDPSWRGGLNIDRSASGAGARDARVAQADASADYVVSSDLGAATAPARLLSATQQTYSGDTCVTYGPVGATGGTNVLASSLTKQSTSTSVSQTVNAGASVSMKYGGLRTSLGASYTGTSSQDSASVYAVADVKSAGMTTNLSPSLTASHSGSQVTSLETAIKMIAECGDTVATSYTSGSMYQAVLKMKTASQSQAQSLYASLSASYSTPGTSTSGSASFSGTVASTSSVSEVSINELCVGPVNGCAGVPGYKPIDTTSVTTALDTFSSNYTAMTAGLGSQCQSSAQAGNCVVRLHYVPIENIISGSIANASAAKAYVSQASTGIYWMLTNAQTWANGYQSLATAYRNAASFTEDGIYTYRGTGSTPATASQLRSIATSYDDTANKLLLWAGDTCGGTKLGSGSATSSSSCLGRMIACANAAVSTSGATAAACLPSSIAPTFTGLQNPDLVAAPQLTAPPTTCDEAVPSARSMSNYNQKTTLYLGGIQAVSYPVWCVWTNGAVTTYLGVTATSGTDQGTTTYAYAPFDPATGALYALPTSYPSNAPNEVRPKCSWTSSCTSPAPLGYAEKGKGYPSHSFVVTLPSNLAFATTTAYYGSGNATLNTPASVGLRSNSWNVTQGANGTALLSDSGYPTAGLTLVVPLNSAYTFQRSTGVSVKDPDANKSCAIAASGKASNSGIASSPSQTTDVSNQQIWYSGSLDGNPRHCKVWLKETSYKHHKTPSWTDGTWFVNSEWGPLYPTFICGYSTEGNGMLEYWVDSSDPSSLSVRFSASTKSERDPTLTVWVQYDNVNAPLSSASGAYVGGMCDENSNNTNMPINGNIKY